MVKKIKFTKESISVALVLILSAILNFVNLSIEGYANEYYAAGVKSMTLSLKNFFFVSFDPAGFVTIDKPPLGFWAQAISAKIFGFSGWSILFPEALAGVISVGLIYYLVKRSFGHAAGLISAVCLAVTPVFVAASRNNTIDNLLVMTLLFACVAFFKAAEKGKIKFLILCLALVGLGFNIKMLEAYMIGPAIYLTYLLATTIPGKKRIQHLVLGTVVLLAVSFSWAVIVDLVPASSRPFVGSSTNNSEIELIIGHNGLERLGLSGKSGPGGGMGPGGQGGFRDRQDRSSQQNTTNSQNNNSQDQNNGAQQPGDNNGPNGGQAPNGNDPNGVAQGQQGNGQAPNGNGPGAWGNGQGQNANGQGPWGNGQTPNGGSNFGGQGGLQGSFGGQTKAGFTRLFSKNMLSDQIVWFLPLALIGFIAAAIKEKLRFKLDNERKLSIVFWIVWLVPEFIYFSFTTGLFHPYYLTMLAPPIAALAGIGITTMWEMYKEGGLKAWLLPAALLVNGAVQVLEVSYFYSSSNAAKFIMIGLIILCFVASVILALYNLVKNEDTSEKENSKQTDKLKKVLVSAAFIGLLIAPTIGSAATWFTKLNGTIPAAGLELLSSGNSGDRGMGMRNGFPGMEGANNGNSKLIQFLKTNAANAKYQVVVSSANSAGQYILNSDISVMALGGFSGSDKILTLDQFKEMVKKGEVRYVLSGGMGGRDSDDIMTWVKENGKLVDSSLYKDTTTQNNQIDDNNNQSGNVNNNETGNVNDTNSSTDSRRGNFGGFGGREMNEQLYDLQELK
ncbi:MAG: glycosyltransferase family 39 protein [Bacillota bacterium]|nr:glycosyltransferase family 39 protein [Bacillota bacterium]